MVLTTTVGTRTVFCRAGSGCMPPKAHRGDAPPGYSEVALIGWIDLTGRPHMRRLKPNSTRRYRGGWTRTVAAILVSASALVWLLSSFLFVAYQQRLKSIEHPYWGVSVSEGRLVFWYRGSDFATLDDEFPSGWRFGQADEPSAGVVAPVFDRWPGHLHIVVPLWLPFVVGAVVWITLALRGRRVRPPLECKHCSYNLTGNVSGICPECGTPIKPLENGQSRGEPGP